LIFFKGEKPMDAISNNAVNLGSLLSNVKAPVDTAQLSDAKAVSKVASVPLPKTNVKESSQEVRDAAETAMKDIQHFISSQARSVRISKDETSGHMIVQLVDPDTGEVIRTLPSEELLRLARSFEMLGNKMVHAQAAHSM
jgi:flagellar protein FlaG